MTNQVAGTSLPPGSVWLQFGVEVDEFDTEDVTRWIECARPRDTDILSVRFMDREEATELSSIFRKKDEPANVLAFEIGVLDILGDIAICIPVAQEEALEQGKTLKAHVAHLVIHGVLHLSGHTHDNDEDAESMELTETLYMKQLGFEDPYVIDV